MHFHFCVLANNQISSMTAIEGEWKDLGVMAVVGCAHVSKNRNGEQHLFGIVQKIIRIMQILIVKK